MLKLISFSFWLNFLYFWLFFLILIGVASQNLPMFGNGLVMARGIYFCCGNQLDNLMHFAYTQSIIDRFPPIEPGMSGVLISNYHYWLNLVVADLVRLFRLPVLPTLFQYTGIFLSLFYGLSLVALARVLNFNQKITRTILFFGYFGADAIYLILLLTGNLSHWSAVSSLEDGSVFLVNPPRAASMVIATVGLALYVLWQKRNQVLLGASAILLLASGILVFLFLGLNTLQKSGAANTFNFLVGAWLFLTLPAALAFEYWLGKSNRLIRAILIVALVALTLPRIISNAYFNVVSYVKHDYLYVSYPELALYDFINKNTPPNALILVDLAHGNDRESPMVYGFTKRPMFLSGKGLLDIHGQDTRLRFKSKLIIFRNNSPVVVAQELTDNQIDYVLLWEANQLAAKVDRFTAKIFQNQSGTLLRVDREEAKKFILQQKQLGL